MSVVLDKRLIEYEDNRWHQQSTLCEYCNAIFSQPNSISLLLSAKGLEQHRKRSSMTENALNGCRLCRELLFIPREDERKDTESTSSSFVRMVQRPLSLWESINTDRENTPISSEDLTSYRHEQNFHFNWRYQGFFNNVIVSRHQTFGKTRELCMQMSIETGRLYNSLP